MEPAVYAGQTVLVDRFTYVISSPKIGDVIAFLPNGNQNSHYYVKRIVAVPGDKLIVRDGVLYVNGIESAWVKEPLEFPGITQNELVLKTGEFFCLGDNADESEDSRSANIGPVNESDIIGKVWFRAGCKKAGMGFVK
jgi:signal peptidase I